MLEKITKRHDLFEIIRSWAIDVIRGKSPSSFPDLVVLTGYDGSALWLEYSILDNRAFRSRIAIQMSERLYNLGIPRNLDLIKPPTRSAVLSILAGQVEDQVCAHRLLRNASQVNLVTADDIVAIALQLSLEPTDQFQRAGERLMAEGHRRCAQAVKTAELVYYMFNGAGRQLVDEQRREQWGMGPNSELSTFMSALQYRGLRREIARRVGSQCADAKGVIIAPPFLSNLMPSSQSSLNPGFVHFAVDWIFSTLRSRHKHGFYDAGDKAREWCHGFSRTAHGLWILSRAKWLDEIGKKKRVRRPSQI